MKTGVSLLLLELTIGTVVLFAPRTVASAWVDLDEPTRWLDEQQLLGGPSVRPATQFPPCDCCHSEAGLVTVSVMERK